MSWLATVLAAIIATVLLAGCGDDAAPTVTTASVPSSQVETASPTTTSPPAMSPTATPAATGTTIGSVTADTSEGQTPSPTEPSLSAFDPCTLLSTDEISSAVGNDVGPPELEAEAQTTCSWRAESLDDVEVTLTVTTPARPAIVCTGSREFAEESGPVEDIPDLGVDAWWEFAGSGSFTRGTVTVCTEDTIVFLVLAGPRAEADLRAASDALMASVLGRIG